ncbi:MAG: tetratricopeptide repeat protein [Armatimonadota bacterium]|nr:tetratricopeptide repeat protein [Armatimonadota bacterium]
MRRVKSILIPLPRRYGLLVLLIPAGFLLFFTRIFVADLYYQRAMTLKQQVYLDRAAAYLQKAIAWQPGNAVYHRELGRVYMAMSPWRKDRERWIEQGIAAYRQSLALNPYDSETAFDLGWAWFAAGNLEEAERAFKSGLQVDPNNPALFISLGATYQAQGKLQEARAVLVRALELSPIQRDAIRKQIQAIDLALARSR